MTDSNAQLTFRALLLGALLAAVLAAANAYLGLMAGLTVSASIPAAVISMGIFRLLQRGSLLENNIVQTTASAGEALAAGAIFTLPALIMLGHWQSFDYGWTLVLTGLGGMLGVLFTIPLRRVLVVTAALPFPEGTATADILRAGHAQPEAQGGDQQSSQPSNTKASQAGGSGLRLLAQGAALAGLVKLLQSGLGLWPAVAEAATRVGGSIAYVGTNLSAALLGVGYIVGLNIALLVFVGGVMAWYVAIPIYSGLYLADDPRPAANLAWEVWNTRIRYLGVGAMLTGGLWALFELRKPLRMAVVGKLDQGMTPQAREDVPMTAVLIAAVAGLAAMSWVYSSVLGSGVLGASLALFMLIAAFLFSAVAGYMAGVVGSSNNPVSGVTIATILLASLLLLLFSGANQLGGAAAAIMVGAVVCCAAAIGGDTMQDMKAGYLLGATPWKQQAAQMLGVVVAALVIGPVLGLLLDGYGFGARSVFQPNALAAPQASLMASVANGVFGGGLPWPMVAIGAVLGAAIIAFDLWLKARNSQWRAPVLAVAVGIYLPLEIAVPILIGGLCAWRIRGSIGSIASGAGKGPDRGGLFAAGLITGEALMGIALAVPIGLAKGANPFALNMNWTLLGTVVFAFLVWRLLRAAKA